MNKIRYNGCNCILRKGKYENDNLALILEDVETGEHVAVATVNTGEILPQDEGFVKDYTENEGVLQALINAGYVKEILRYTTLGYVTNVPLVKFNLEGVKEL